jgi:hypothetical protein
MMVVKIEAARFDIARSVRALLPKARSLPKASRVGGDAYPVRASNDHISTALIGSTTLI